MRFVEGYVFEELRKHLERMELYKNKEDLERLKNRLDAGSSNLIAWIEDNEVAGHTIWHETSTEEHSRGSPRDRGDRETLERLAGGGRGNLVELHEIGLEKKHRGRGYGKEFFEFFEKLIRDKGYDGIVYYAFDPAAIAICRKRGYREEYGYQEAGPEGEMQTCYTFFRPLKKKQ